MRKTSSTGRILLKSLLITVKITRKSRISQSSIMNSNYYYKGVGGDAVPSNGVLHHSNSSPLQPLRIGEVKILLNTIDTSKATCAVQTTSKAGCPKKGR